MHVFVQLGPKAEDVMKPVNPVASLADPSWYNCSYLLCTSFNLHVDQGQNCSKGLAHLRLENEVGVYDGQLFFTCTSIKKTIMVR